MKLPSSRLFHCCSKVLRSPCGIPARTRESAINVNARLWKEGAKCQNWAALSLIPGGSTQKRWFNTGDNPNYEGDGRTTVTILNHEADSPLLIDAYHENGFVLNNGFTARGPIAIFPRTVLGWDVENSDGVTPESLVMFTLLEPKLDILIIGVGDVGRKIPVETLKMLRQKKINFEILSTDHALSTFNFLNYERRCVAAALIPPRKIVHRMEDIARNKLNKKRLYEEDDDEGYEESVQMKKDMHKNKDPDRNF